MRLRDKRSPFFVAALLAGVILPAPSRAVRVPRIELLREVAVSGATISLSDLLPAGAGDSVRARAEEVSLGAAPQPGVTRLIERSSILAGIGASRDLLEEIAIPGHVAVTAGARALTVTEVFVVIQRALRESGFSAADELSPQDVLLQPRILVREGDPGLEVLRSEFDLGMKCARFLLWPSHDPKVLPFYVAMVLPAGFGPASGPFEGSKPMVRPHGFGAVRGAMSKATPTVLVSPDEKATLVLQSVSLSVIADVVPLERGSLGQQIRVRVADTGKVFRAKVDGRAHLELNF